jgi:hypothetical protein
MLTLRFVAEFVDGGDVTVKEPPALLLPQRAGKSRESQCTYPLTGRLSLVQSRIPTIWFSIASFSQSMVSYTSLAELLSAVEHSAGGTR